MNILKAPSLCFGSDADITPQVIDALMAELNIFLENPPDEPSA